MFKKRIGTSIWIELLADILGGILGGIIGFFLAGPIGVILGGVIGPVITFIIRKWVGERDDLKQSKSISNNFNKYDETLPFETTAFLGREEEINQVKKLVQRNYTRLITLAGPPGVGKTRLAIQIAKSSKSSFGDGVAFVSLVSVRNKRSLLPTIMQALRIKTKPSKSPLDVLIESIGNKKILLILDNLEQIKDAAQIINELLSKTSNLKIIATSREYLQIYGEHQFAILPLAYPKKIINSTSDNILKYPAITLFIKRVQEVNPYYSPRKEDLPKIVEICKLLNGLPLAIELAAINMKNIHISTLLSQLQDKINSTPSKISALSRHYNTMKGALDWSFDLLSAKEQGVFTRLGIFSGGFSKEAANFVINSESSKALFEVSDLIDSLVDKNLIIRYINNGEERFDILFVIKEYLQGKLYATKIKSTLCDWHLMYYFKLAESADAKLRGSERIKFLHLLRTEYSNIQSALNWAITNEKKLETGTKLAIALQWFWHFEGMWAEGILWLRKFDVKHTQMKDKYTSRPKIMNAMALLSLYHSDTAKARIYIEQCMELIKNKRKNIDLAYMLTLSGMESLWWRNYKDAERPTRRSVKLFRALNDEWGLAYALFWRGEVLSRLKILPDAKSCYEESLAIFKEFGDTWSMSLPLHGLGMVAFSEKKMNHSLSMLKTSLNYLEENEDKEGESWTLLKLGLVSEKSGNLKLARKYYNKSLQIRESLEDNSGISTCLASIGKIELLQKSFNKSYSAFVQSLMLTRNSDNKEGKIISLQGLALALARKNDKEKSATIFGFLENSVGADKLLHGYDDSEDVITYMNPLLDELKKTSNGLYWKKGYLMTLEQIIDYVLHEKSAL